MKRLNNIFLAFLALVVVACGDPDLPFDTFEDLEKGAYARRLSVSGAFTFGQTATSRFDVSVEFYSEDQGQNVASYDWTVQYTGVAGDRDAVAFLSVPASSFTTNSDSGLPMATFSLEMGAALTALGLTDGDITGGDTFRFLGDVVLNDGRRFGSANTGVNLVSSASFRALNRVDANVVCVSDLGGTYNSVAVGTSTDPCCPTETTVNSTVTLTDNGDGVYTISDWSAGLYLEWYDVYGITAATDMTLDTFNDVCETITSPEFTEPFDREANITGSVNTATGVITYEWDNGWGDEATVTLTPQ